MTFNVGFGFASVMMFIACAAFVCSGQFGLGPTQFSLAFAVNVVGFFAASQAAGPISDEIGMPRVIRWAAAGVAGLAQNLLGGALVGQVTHVVIIAGLLLANACLGLVIPSAIVVALDPHGEIVGLVSPLGGTLQVVSGSVIVVLKGLLFDGTATPMIAAAALCAVLTLAITLVTPRTIVRVAPAGSGTARSAQSPEKDKP